MSLGWACSSLDKSDKVNTDKIFKLILLQENHKAWSEMGLGYPDTRNLLGKPYIAIMANN